MIRAASFVVAIAFSLGLTLAPGQGRAAETATADSLAVPAVSPVESIPADELASLAEREEASPQLQQFRGGHDTVVISTSVIVLVLVIVLIILIIR